MKRFLRIVILLIVGLAVLAGALVITARYLPETELVRTNVEDYLKEATGKNVRLGHMEVSASFPNLVRITVNGATMTDAHQKKLLSAEKVELIPSLGSLLRREFSVESVIVKDLRMNISREVDGTIHWPFDGSGPSGTATRTGKGCTSGLWFAVGQGQGDAQQKTPVRWSIKKITLIDAELDWTDTHITPGAEVVVRIKGVGGTIVQGATGRDLQVDLAGRLDSGKAKPSPVKITGVLTLASDLAGLESASPKVRLESCELGSFRAYLPTWMTITDLGLLDVSLEAQWKNEQACTVSLHAVPGQGTEPTHAIEISGESTIAPDWSRVESCQFAGKAAGIPLSIFASALPGELPFDPTKGTVRADLQGKLESGMDWEAWGSVSLEKTVAVGMYRTFAKEITVDADLRITPTQLTLKKAQVSDTSRLLSAAGTVANPFSADADMDLSVETKLKSDWLKAAGISLPSELSVKGIVPARGTLRGTRRNLGISLKGDLKAVAIAWSPYIEKPSGKDGDFHLKGKSVSTKGSSQRAFDGTFSGKLTGARTRVTDKGKWLDPATVEIGAKVKTKSHTMDLQDVSIAVKKGSDGNKVVSVTGSVEDVRSSAPRIDLRVGADLGNEFLEMVEPGVLPVGISGIVPLAGQFKGSMSDGKWSVEVPLDRTGLAVGRVFVKDAGSAGLLKVRGKWSHRAVELEKGQLTLVGLAVAAKGMLLDAQGKLGALEFTVPKTDTKFLAKYFPEVRPYRLSGPVEASIRIKPSDSPEWAGTIRLLSLGCKPEKSGFTVNGLRGDVEIDQSSVRIKGLEGKLGGLVDGPLTIQGRATDVDSPEKVSGNFNVQVGRGVILGEYRTGLVNQAVEFLKSLKILPSGLSLDQISEFESLTGDLALKGDIVSTENLRIVGPLARWGVVGKLPVMARNMELLVGVRTQVEIANPLDKVPAVKDMVEKHKDILKMTGIDKDLKRLGIDVSGSDKAQEPKANNGGRSRTLFLRVHGPASDPKPVWVPANSIEPETLAKLNALIK